MIVRQVPVDLSTVVHSVSSTREYERCPARYRFGYLDRTEPTRHAPPNWRFGSIVHLGLEAGYRHRWIHGSTGSMLDCLPTAVRAVERAWDELDMPDGDGVHRAVCVTTGHLVSERIGGSSIVGVEELLTADGDDQVRIAGYADLILRDGDRLEIRDHKVTSYERTPEELAGDFQLNLYGWMAARRWPSATGIVASHSYPLSGRVVRARLDGERMARAHGRVQRAAAAIASDEVFAPRPGEHCRSCRWLELCPAGGAHLG